MNVQPKNEKKQYQIRLELENAESGVLEFDRLSRLTRGIQRIAEHALRIRVEGVLHAKGAKATWLRNLVKIELHAIESGSTILKVSCPTFGSTFNHMQLELWNSFDAQSLFEMTPVAIVRESFRLALSQELETDYLDKPLLQEMSVFARFFSSYRDSLIIEADDAPAFLLNLYKMHQVRQIEQKTPPAKQMMLTGQLDLLEYSTSRLKLITANNKVKAILGEGLSMDSVREMLGKFITVIGVATYNPAGQIASVEVQEIRAPEKGDVFFLRARKARNIEQLIEEQKFQKRSRVRLEDILGRWPGEESFEELSHLVVN